MSTPAPVPRDIAAELAAVVLGRGYPCLGATSVFRRGRAVVRDFGSMTDPRTGPELADALAEFATDRIGSTLNVFMNVWTERDGELHIDPPTSRAGDALVLRAEIDLIVGLTACSAEKSNAGVCKPIDYRID